ncbi:MAG TPA: hypothetical protein VK590_11570 [Saprospiraceae bacterium]|nr:hypothetical protein [Saprospiraceae bacterium]
MYCVFNALVGIITTILFIFKIPNLIFLFLIIWVEVIILYFFFKDILNLKKKHDLWVLLIVFLVFGSVFYTYESFKILPSYSRFIECIFIFLLSLIYYHNELENPKSGFIHKNPVFWFVTGFFLYYGGTMFLLLFAKYFTGDKIRFAEIWTVYNLLNILEYIVLIYGFICYRRTLKA